MPFSRAGVAEHEECHLPLSSPGDYGVPGRHPVTSTTMPTQSRMGEESARSMSRTKSHINDKSSLGMQRMMVYILKRDQKTKRIRQGQLAEMAGFRGRRGYPGIHVRPH